MKMTGMTVAALLISLGLWNGAASAAEPSTADVLAKLHHSNMNEIEMGKLAQKEGQSKDVKSFGKTLVSDHSAADRKVQALAKKQKVELPSTSGAHKMTDLPSGATFDGKFARSMLDDHKKDVAEATEARDKTTDPALKSLLTDIVPTLQKHQDIAQRLVDSLASK
jgi:putative membrane protein